MTGFGIHDNDLLVVDRSAHPADRSIVIAVIDGQFTIKQLCRIPDGVLLRSGGGGHPLLDPGLLGGKMNRAVQLPGAQQFDRVQSGKQPAAVEHLALRSGHAPPNAQTFQQDRRQHRVAILLSFASTPTSHLSYLGTPQFFLPFPPVRYALPRGRFSPTAMRRHWRPENQELLNDRFDLAS
ncbi:MAG: S24 family peptidase [Sulfuritalea sp.]|nr:S24 family peptidase [Sulfuritalea sp.]